MKELKKADLDYIFRVALDKCNATFKPVIDSNSSDNVSTDELHLCNS